ncbi:MAG: poly(3-hydroxyalkanoate) depolymerase [Ktedonobacterales bacterium]
MVAKTTKRSTRTGTAREVRLIRVMGQQLNVAIRPGDGRRTPLLLMNGIGANLELLQPFVDALPPEIEVIRFDVPGTGGSPTPPLLYRFPALAWLVGRMLDKLHYQYVDVLGISWGGALAQQFALQNRWRCRRLVLVSTATGAIMIPGKLSVLAELATPRRYYDPAYMESIAPDVYGGVVPEDFAVRYGDALVPAHPRGYAYQMMAGAGWTSVPWLHCLRQPTLILSGDDDPLIPPANAKLMHRLIPHSRMQIFHGGHLGLVLQAQELAGVIDSFLAAP